MRSWTVIALGVALFLGFVGGRSFATEFPDSAVPAQSNSVLGSASITESDDTSGAGSPVTGNSPRRDVWPNWLVALLSAVVGGVSGAAVAHYLDVKQAARSDRRATLREMVGSRHDVRGQPFTKALNEAIVVYGDQPEVIRGIEDIMQSSDNDKLYSLYSCMAKAAGIDVVSIDTFLKAFNVNPIR